MTIIDQIRSRNGDVRRPLIMGVLNVTPDSFSDGGLFFDTEKAVDHGKRMEAEGADIIDIGGESTKPFSDQISLEEESRRVLPVIEKLVKSVSIPISIDTTKSEIADRALAAGAAIINDVSALRFDPRMAEIAVAYNVPVILMHMLGNPKSMQKNPQYRDVVSEVKAFLLDAVEKAAAAGIKKANLIIDPGIGFGKTVEHNLLLIKHLKALTDIGRPVLVGASRKFFIRSILKTDDQEPDPLSQTVEIGAQAVVAAALLNGADIVRVHNVENTKATLKIIQALKSA